MRNPARIPVVLERIRRAWEAVPDMTLREIIWYSTLEVEPGPVEDAALAGLIERYVHRERTRREKVTP